jgi:Arm DNA-binding domain
MPKLTKRLVDQLQSTATDYTVWDSDVRGFGCRVHARGRKTFIVKYRVGGGPRRHATQDGTRLIRADNCRSGALVGTPDTS